MSCRATSACVLLVAVASAMRAQGVQQRTQKQNSPPPYPEQTLARINLPPNLTADQLFQLGAQLDQKKRYRLEAAVYSKCADMQNARCMSALGMMYDQALGVPHDEQRAVWYITRAAYMGNRGAEYQLGVFWELGQILPADMKTAMQWYRKAAEADSPYGERRLGLAYEFGETVPRNRQEAIRWLTKSANHGDGLSTDLVLLFRNPKTPHFKTYEELGDYYHGLWRDALMQWMQQSGTGGGAQANNGAYLAIGNTIRDRAMTAYRNAGDMEGARLCSQSASCGGR
jgi:TPR repeat protein